MTINHHSKQRHATYAQGLWRLEGDEAVVHAKRIVLALLGVGLVPVVLKVVRQEPELHQAGVA